MIARRQTNWHAYAEVYDLMAANNPAYQELIDRYRQAISAWQFEPGAVLADVGAGTGNFSLELAAAFPQCRVLHVDGSAEMNRLAVAKARARGLTNMEFVTCDIWDSPIQVGSLAAVTTVHAIYAFPRPKELLAEMFRWLRPGGQLFACDAGRKVNVRDWALYIFRDSCRRQGLRRTLQLFYRGRVVSRQNRLIAEAQASGEFWTHSHQEFTDAIRAAGFDIQAASLAYRGCSDIVVGCRA